MAGPVNFNSNELPTITPMRGVARIWVLDAMGIVRQIKKTGKIKILANLIDDFCQRVENVTKPCSEIHSLFDDYRNRSLKTRTRDKRATTDSSYLPTLN